MNRYRYDSYLPSDVTEYRLLRNAISRATETPQSNKCRALRSRKILLSTGLGWKKKKKKKKKQEAYVYDAKRPSNIMAKCDNGGEKQRDLYSKVLWIHGENRIRQFKWLELKQPRDVFQGMHSW